MCSHLVVEELADDEACDGRKFLVIYRPGFVSCFWDARASGVTCGLGSGLDAQGGIKPLTTAEARTAQTFQTFGWDLERVWTMQEGKSYPRAQMGRKNAERLISPQTRLSRRFCLCRPRKARSGRDL
jgi:hypothetical protein